MDEDQTERILYHMDRIDEAYVYSPTGPWWKRWIPGVCKHEQVRCTHGDEIIGRRWRRRVCMICGRSLKGVLPEMCFFTGEQHHIEDEENK
jgi:hypothetical protein